MIPNTKQQEVLDLLSGGYAGVLNIVGEGGTGKSFLIEEIAKLYPKCSITATTGIAATSIGGKTLHSYLGLKAVFNDEAEVVEDATIFEGSKLVGSDDTVLIIDESSMMGKDLFSKVLKSKYKLLILVGDKEQLRPVKDVYVDYSVYKTIELTEQMRTKSSAYNLIQDYRVAKTEDTEINIFDYVDGVSVEHIKLKDLKEHYDNNVLVNKRVISYRNDTADNIISMLAPTSKKYQLLSSISVYDGKENLTLSVNGEVVEVEKKFKYFREAKDTFFRKHFRECKHRTKWNVSYPFKFEYVSMKNIDTHFIKFLHKAEDVAIYDEYKAEVFKHVKELKRWLIATYGEDWKKHRDDDYLSAVRILMELSNNMVRGRHVCSMTAHKSQGQSIGCVYIMVDDIGNRKDLIYVALSRAISKIVLITEEGK